MSLTPTLRFEPSPLVDRLRLLVTPERLHLIAAITIYRIVMDYSYATFLVPVNEDVDHLTNTLSPEKYFESWVIMYVCALFLPTRTRKPSDFLLHACYFMPFLGQISLYAYLDGSRTYAYATWATFLILAAARNVNLTIPNIRIKDGNVWLPVVCSVLVVAICAAYYVIVGLGKFDLNLLNVYENRSAINTVIGNSPILGYLGTWVYKVFNVFLIAWALMRRKYFFALFLYGAQVYLFGVTSQKAVLIYPFLVLLVYLIGHRNQTSVRLTWILTAVVALGILEELTVQTRFWNDFVVRRQLWIPARIDWVYYDFFSTHGFVYMSDSVLRALTRYPFQIPPPNMIGIVMLNNVNAHADTGFLGTSYMHFGVAGMFGFALAIGLLLRLTDALTLSRMPVWLGLAATIGPFFNLFSDSDLFTTLATHGLGVAMLVLLIYGQPGSQNGGGRGWEVPV